MQSQLEENEQIILNEQKRRKKKHLNIDTAKEKPKQINSLAQLEFYSLMDSDSVVFFFFSKVLSLHFCKRMEIDLNSKWTN